MNSRNVVKAAFGTALMVLAFAIPASAGDFPATGQTTSYQADNNDGIDGPVDVPDDGALQRGKSLRYKILHDGTIKDLNTGLIWEVKCDTCPGGDLHYAFNSYPWSGDGSTDTIWDWLDKVNSEGGKGYAGHSDWRIPNVRELQSLVDFGVFIPSIAPIFNPTAVAPYWSSTSNAFGPSTAWTIYFFSGIATSFGKGDPYFARAVRGGKK
jgi:hypothetical protein